MKRNGRGRLRLAALGFSRKHLAQSRAASGKSDLVWLATALLLIGATATPTYLYMQRLLDATKQAARSHLTLSSLTAVTARMEQADSCRNDYALFQDEHQLRCFEEAAGTLLSPSAELRQLARDNPLEHENLEALDNLIRARVKLLQESVSLQEVHGYRPAEQLSLARAASDLRHQVRMRIGSLENREQDMLADRLLTTRTAALKVVALVGLETLVSAAILCFFVPKLRQEIGKRVSAQYFMRLAYAALEFAHRHLDGIVESTPDSIAAVDHSLEYIVVNGKYKNECQLRYGRSPEAGAKLDAVFANCADALAESTQLWRRALAGETFAATEEFCAPGQDRIFFEVRYFPIRNRSNAPIAACRIARDVTERKNVESLLLCQSEELARSNAELEQFAYVASHDLQEPLRMVSSYVQLLAERYHQQLDAKAEKFMGYAIDGAQRMQALINDLLALSRVNSRSGEFTEVNSGEVLERVLHDLKAAIKESQTKIEHGDLPMVTADEGQLYQLFQNLIGNAIKFRGDQPPRINLEAKPLGDHWLFAIRDNGIGIAPEHSERIFLLFQRLHSRQQYGGTGIGLAICKKIVERHRGRIWVESEPGQGSTFCFTLPISKEINPRPQWREVAAHA
jgi:signal transduction histidine kinase/CHASE3 domain sensor protein